MQTLEPVGAGQRVGPAAADEIKLVAPGVSDASVGRRGTSRAFDVVFAVMALVLTVPLFLAIALAVKTTSEGPIIYRSRRYAAGGSRFDMLKFRTMVSDRRQAELLATNPTAQSQLDAEFKLMDDPRVTAVGRFLRRSSLDELPQLLNVLWGQMSIVGPRPKLEDEGRRYGDVLGLVLSVRPGITGSWQTQGRNDLPFHRRIELDVEYVLGRSFLWDIRICAITVVQLLSPKRHGAY